MTSSIKLLLSLRVAVSREVASGDFPPAEQGNNIITANLGGVDLDVWNDAYIAKIALAGGGGPTTIDLQNFTSLLFETGVSLDKVYGIAIQAILDDADAPDASCVVTGGASNPFSEPFTDPAEGIAIPAGMTVMMIGATDFAGWTVDGTHKTLAFDNPGTDDLTATVIILGGN